MGVSARWCLGHEDTDASSAVGFDAEVDAPAITKKSLFVHSVTARISFWLPSSQEEASTTRLHCWGRREPV